jgi:hypothetical protein
MTGTLLHRGPDACEHHEIHFDWAEIAERLERMVY